MEEKLLELIFSTSNTVEIHKIAEELEKESNFNLCCDIEHLKGIWEPRWSNSKAPFLKYSPLVDNLQILDPTNINGLNLLKTRGLKSFLVPE